MTPERAVAHRCCGPFCCFFPPHHPPDPAPFFSLSGGFFGVKVLKILPSLAPNNLPQRGDSSSKSPNFSPSYPPETPPVWCFVESEFHLKKYWIWAENANIPPKISPYISPERADNWEDVRGVDWEFVREGYPWKSGWRGRCGGFGWGLLLRRMPPEREKMTGVCAGKRLGKVGGKVAEIEFFEIWNGAKKCHLSADKWTKNVDKVFIIKKTIT